MTTAKKRAKTSKGEEKEEKIMNNSTNECQNLTNKRYEFKLVLRVIKPVLNMDGKMLKV